MNPPTPEEVPENSLPVGSALDSEIRDLLKQENIKPAQTSHTKFEFDAERIRSSSRGWLQIQSTISKS
jgi:hypothetical protein